MVMILAIFAMLAAGNLMAAPPDGIPRDLARQRATQISDLRYHLRFTLTPHTPSISGHEDLQFHSRFSGPLLLDFRDGTAANLTVNGVPVPAKMDHGHLELPVHTVHRGENKVSMDFTAPVATAGKALTPLENHDEHTHYLYKLVLPMDAGIALHCLFQTELKIPLHL